MAKDGRFYMRLTQTERDMLQELADANGVTGSAWMRMMIHQQHRELFGAKPPERPSKAKR